MNLTELFRHETDLLTLPADQTLFHEGDKGNLMYVIMSGTALISVLLLFIGERIDGGRSILSALRHPNPETGVALQDLI